MSPPLSRRELLAAGLATVGSISIGYGTAASLIDTERFPARTQAQTLTLQADPTWKATGSLGAVRVDETGREQLTLTLGGPASYVWFRTRCPQCLPVEKVLAVRLQMDTTGDGTPDRPLTDGYVPLRVFRARFGSGMFIGTMPADSSWELHIDWRLTDQIEATEVTFQFEFAGRQAHPTLSPEPTMPEWQECTGCVDSPPTAIRWLSLCGSSEPLQSVPPRRDPDAQTVTIDTAAVPESVTNVILGTTRTLAVVPYTGQNTLTWGMDGVVEEVSLPMTDTTAKRLQTETQSCVLACRYLFAVTGSTGTWICEQPAQDRTTDTTSS